MAPHQVVIGFQALLFPQLHWALSRSTAGNRFDLAVVHDKLEPQSTGTWPVPALIISILSRMAWDLSLLAIIFQPRHHRRGHTRSVDQRIPCCWLWMPLLESGLV